MDLLLSLLAFAVTMLVLATVVTTILELIARLLQRRAHVFTHMLGMVFEKEIKPLLLKHAIATGDKARETFAAALMESPLARGQAASLARFLRPGANKSDELSTEEFLRRLARSEFGQALYGEARGQLQPVIDRITTRYEELGAAAREHFRNSSIVYSLIIGVILAVSYNVDGLRLLRFFADNPNVAATVAAGAEQSLKDFDAAQTRLKTEMEKLAASAAASAAPAQEAAEVMKDVKTTIAGAQQSLDSLRTKGLPIGPGQFPHCLWRDADTKHPDPRCQTKVPPATSTWTQICNHAADIVIWLLSAIATGLAIGLGGPFWYDAVTGLMRVTQMLRGRSPTPDAAASAAPDKAPPSPTETFVKHVEQPAPAGPTYPRPRWRPATSS